MGWASVCAVVAVLSLGAWLFVGTALYLSGPASGKISKRQLEAQQAKYYTASARRLSTFAYLVYISRQGIRVSTDMEEKGGAPTIIP